MARQMIVIAACCFVLINIASAMSTSRAMSAFGQGNAVDQQNDQDTNDDLTLDRIGSGDETEDQSQEDITGDFQSHNNVNLQRKLFDIKWMAKAAKLCAECIKHFPKDKKTCIVPCAILEGYGILGAPSE